MITPYRDELKAAQERIANLEQEIARRQDLLDRALDPCKHCARRRDERRLAWRLRLKKICKAAAITTAIALIPSILSWLLWRYNFSRPNKAEVERQAALIYARDGGDFVEPICGARKYGFFVCEAPGRWPLICETDWGCNGVADRVECRVGKKEP